MMRALRMVWPPWWALFWAGLAYAGHEAFYLVLQWSLGFPDVSIPEMKTVYLGLCANVAAFYAAYRVWSFHPVWRNDYSYWLARTPWTSRQPLPLGPLHLVWQDVLILTLGVLVVWPRLQILAMHALQVFLLAYLAGLAVSHYLTGEKGWAYAILFGLGAMVLFALKPLFFVAVAAVTYGIAYLGLRASLARFPWEGAIASKVRDPVRRMTSLGWPYRRLGPGGNAVLEFSQLERFVACLLGGWGYYIFCHHATGNGLETFYFVMLGFGVPIRLAIYCNANRPTISMWGRLVLGRWIIPGYDQIFLAPLMALLVGAATWYALYRLRWDLGIVVPIAFTLTVWILCGMGPRLRDWRLTGNHRIVVGMMFFKELPK